MHNTKLIQKFTLLLCIVFMAFGYVAKAEEYIRPANPVMDYVPQNIGIYDTYYQNFYESDCRTCHGLSTAEQHHGTDYARKGECLFCHIESLPPETQMDCKVCHVDEGPIGDFGFPHHRSDHADSNQCNQCHPQVVETNTIEPPNYEPSSITPTPHSCENCHWPSGKRPHKPPLRSDWLSWTSTPKPTWTDGIENPQPIEANGTVFNGTLSKKPYKPSSGTHHEIDGKVYPKCSLCHASSPDSQASWDLNNPYLIRFCESCHSVGTLHSIQGHIKTDNIYTVDGVRNQTVTAEEKCIACHGNGLPELPPLPSDKPEINSLEPNFGPPGIVVDILPASGQCWTDDPVNGICSFGQKMIGDVVKMGQKNMQGNWNWIDVPIYSWSEYLIQIKVPGGTFQPGNTRVKVYKNNVGTSAHKNFSVRKHPGLYSLNPSVGNWDQVIDITGVGFGVKQEKVYGDGYGYSSYMQLYTQNDTYRVNSDPVFWDQDQVSIRMKDLLDINSGKPIPERGLYAGRWNVSIVTDFFKDDSDGTYNYGLAGLDTPTNPQGTGPGDELIYRVVSNPLCFAVTKEPYINSVEPDFISFKDTAKIQGSNFGKTQGTSVVRIWNNKKTEFKVAKIIYWSKTEITFKVPAFETNPAKYPQNKWLQVVVCGFYGKTKSNYQPLTIYSPKSKH